MYCIALSADYIVYPNKDINLSNTLLLNFFILFLTYTIT